MAITSCSEGGFVYFNEELTTNWEGVNIMPREWKIISSVAVFLVTMPLAISASENEFLFRTGVAYEFEIGRWSITPQFNVDFVDGEEAYVYGLSFGWGF